MKHARNHSGFTLIELLVVVAIIAILAVVVVLTLNPGQLLMQARDSNRISDLSTIKSAISYYLQDVVTTTATLGSSSFGTCYEDGAKYSGSVVTTTCPWFQTATSTVISTSGRITATTTSWIPINLSLISVGAPIGQWPVDPINQLGHATGTVNTSTDFFYSYAASATTIGGYKLAAHMESAKYHDGGVNDVESKDGGMYADMYEQGINLSL